MGGGGLAGDLAGFCMPCPARPTQCVWAGLPPSHMPGPWVLTGGGTQERGRDRSLLRFLSLQGTRCSGHQLL